MRNEPPISTSSPRETTTFRPDASAERVTSRAAAPLLTASAARPGQPPEPALHAAAAVAAATVGQVELEIAVAGRHSLQGLTRGSESGARPRLCGAPRRWPLSTRRSSGRCSAAARVAIRAASWSAWAAPRPHA